MRSLRLAPASLLLLLACGCYSVHRHRDYVVVETAGGDTQIRAELWRGGGPIVDGTTWPAGVVVGVLLYPLDIVASAVVSARAMFLPHEDIQLGPLGAVAAIALPWITAVPVEGHSVCQVREVDAAQFAEILAAVRAGRGGARLAELMAWGAEDLAALAGVEVVAAATPLPDMYVYRSPADGGR